ncbi:MAG: hypothetical protein AAGF83_09620 [Cyanobacteria bacterium P01_G01_bin.67]
MKYKVFGLGLILTIISNFCLLNKAKANVTTFNDNNDNLVGNMVKITPADLVNAGYQGRLINFDIPRHQGFTTAIKSGKVDSQLLVKTAIKSGRLELEMIDNRSYLSNVQDLLNNFDRD